MNLYFEKSLCNTFVNLGCVLRKRVIRLTWAIVLTFSFSCDLFYPCPMTEISSEIDAIWCSNQDPEPYITQLKKHRDCYLDIAILKEQSPFLLKFMDFDSNNENNLTGAHYNVNGRIDIWLTPSMNDLLDTALTHEYEHKRDLQFYGSRAVREATEASGKHFVFDFESNDRVNYIDKENPCLIKTVEPN